MIARELNRPVHSVRKMAEALFPERKRAGPWTAREVQELKRYLGATNREVIARILGRPMDEVERQILALGRLQTDAPWGREEVARLKRLYGTRTDDDLALIFGRPVRSIQQLAEQCALAKDKAFLRKLKGESATRMPRWGDTELQTLKELYPRVSNLEIARRLNRSVKSVVSKAHNMGLRKDRERLREMGRQNVRLRYRDDSDGEG
ncbi:MAG: hypothetical protein AAF682_05500 [Planctomycetota bacterium]